MLTETYKNWLSKTKECGFTNEQACGLAILYAWKLTAPKKDGESQNTELFWQFVDKNHFDDINENAFSTNDFIEFIPVFKLAGEILRVPMSKNRFDHIGDPTTLLDLDWENEQVTGQNIDDVLLLRHRFDLLWCQTFGESLREEIRTPIHAYVFASSLTHALNKYDPQCYSGILNKLLWKQSPFVRMFTSIQFVNESNGLANYEPFQIAFRGFLSDDNLELGEALWNLQRLLFYKQPDGAPINLDKQDLPLTSFFEFSTPLVVGFIDEHMPRHAELSRIVASEYLFRSHEYGPHSQLYSLMEDRYGFTSELENESKPLNLLMNAASFYTVCCLKIRNLTNRISELPTLRMLDDIGFLWTRDVEQVQPLRDEAIQCFDVMLSWRSGASWGLFLETESGFIQRAYIGDKSEYAEVDDIFAKICCAYQPKRCVIAFWTHRTQEIEGKNQDINEVAFLNIERDGSICCEVFNGETDSQRGRYLGEYKGTIKEQSFCKNYFVKAQSSFFNIVNKEFVKKDQIELLEFIAFPNAWNFSINHKDLEDEMNELTSEDFMQEIFGVERGFFWPFKKTLISKLNINVMELEELLGIDTSAEKYWFDLYVKFHNEENQDNCDSIDKLKIEANNGNPFSQNDYACSLLNSGEDKDFDYLKYYFDSAAQSFPYAQVTLGWFHLHGLNGVERNAEEAFNWNLRGATQGHPEGANNLAFQYENGLGVDIDLNFAKHWYTYASIRGSNIALGHLLYLLKNEL